MRRFFPEKDEHLHVSFYSEDRQAKYIFRTNKYHSTQFCSSLHTTARLTEPHTRERTGSTITLHVKQVMNRKNAEREIAVVVTAYGGDLDYITCGRRQMVEHSENPHEHRHGTLLGSAPCLFCLSLPCASSRYNRSEPLNLRSSHLTLLLKTGLAFNPYILNPRVQKFCIRKPLLHCNSPVVKNVSFTRQLSADFRDREPDIRELPGGSLQVLLGYTDASRDISKPIWAFPGTASPRTGEGRQLVLRTYLNSAITRTRVESYHRFWTFSGLSAAAQAQRIKNYVLNKFPDMTESQ